jgi:trimeric autotransporter adhesin
VNVSQLMAEDAKVNNVSNNVANIVSGGGIKYFHADATSSLADSSASGKDSIAIGGAAVASTSNSVALGSYATASSSTLTASGFAPGGATLSGATAFGELSVGASGKERRITNVAAGYAATDAVNVSQLMAEDAKVNSVSNNVGNLSNSVNIINGSITTINNQVTNIVNGVASSTSTRIRRARIRRRRA